MLVVLGQFEVQYLAQGHFSYVGSKSEQVSLESFAEDGE